MSPTRRDFLRIAAGTGVAVAGGSLKPLLAQPKRPLRDVIVVLPGIMGSVLQKDGRDAWNLSGSAIVNGIRSLGGSISSLTISGNDPGTESLGDGVVATSLIRDTHLIPGFWKIDGYSYISTYLTSRFDARRGQNYFEFPYDWRRDNRVAARRLAKESRQWLAKWRQTSGNKDAKLVLLAHSMGGLVSRYFLEVLEGWRDTRMLVTFGTPYRGSLNALDFLANGIRKTIGPFTLVDVSALIRSFTSAYQLLPIYNCYDAGTGKLARVGDSSGIPHLSSERAIDALKFHNEILEAVKQNSSKPGYISGRYSVHPIIGIYQPTLQTGRLVNGVVQCSQSYENDATVAGDGTVPRPSARPIETPDLERLHRMVYVSEVHGSLQNSPAMLDHVGGLLEESLQTFDPFRLPGRTGPPLPPPPILPEISNVAVIVDDLYGASEPIVVGALCESAATLTTTVTNTATGQVVATAPLTITDPGGRGTTATIGPLAEGTYRVTVSGGANVRSATDVFIVVNDKV
jgi:lecithin:cholesterol acyltransferase